MRRPPAAGARQIIEQIIGQITGQITGQIIGSSVPSQARRKASIQSRQFAPA
jgi:hypothetical protein